MASEKRESSNQSEIQKEIEIIKNFVSEIVMDVLLERLTIFEKASFNELAEEGLLPTWKDVSQQIAEASSSHNFPALRSLDNNDLKME